MFISRDTFYRYQEFTQTGGIDVLINTNRRTPNLKNRVDEITEQAVVTYAIEQPVHGQHRTSNELRKKGIFVSGSGVRSIWLRHNLENFKKRLKALEEKVANEGIILTDSQVATLEKKKQDDEACGEIETAHPGYLGSQDTFFKQHNLSMLRILTDRGTEFCGRVEQHDYQLYLAINDIDHTKTKIKAMSPQTNGICERFHKTILIEFYQITFRKKLYQSLDELQKNLDDWINYYNNERTYQGKMCCGRTPIDTLIDRKRI